MPSKSFNKKKQLMTQAKSINRIVILGGGSAGWLTAGVIAAEHCAGGQDSSGLMNVTITLGESPNISTVGVGEGTWPSMRSTLQKMGISETDLITKCDASFKQGTLFYNWRTGNGDSYTHPFTVPHGYTDTNLADQWRRFRHSIPFAEAVSSQNSLMFNDLAPKQITTPEYAFNANYGYHLDAAKFADLLRFHCVENLNVKHVIADMVGVNSHDSGDISSLIVNTGKKIEGDLFIDCSGSRALLLGEFYKVPLTSKKKFLFNDTALASQVPYCSNNDPIASSTIASAQTNGWIWDIGLPTRRGIGHVFSSAHSNEDEVSQKLLKYIKKTVSAEAASKTSIRKISFSPGHRAKFWHKNCVAIGMSAGFIEPLEASALVLVELSASMLSDQLPANRKVMDIVAKRFNDKFLYRWDAIIDFLKMHYILSERKDTDYWKDNVSPVSIPDSLAEKMDLWCWQSPWHRDTMHVDEMFPSASFQYVLYGMGFHTQARLTNRRSESEAQNSAEQLFQENAQRTKKMMASMPTNRELINKIHTYGLQKI